MGRLAGDRAAVGVGLGVVLLLLAGLAGCAASGSSSAATTTTGQPDAAAVWRELVRCARANGMPSLPDPQIDSNGQAHFPSGTHGFGVGIVRWTGVPSPSCWPRLATARGSKLAAMKTGLRSA